MTPTSILYLLALPASRNAGGREGRANRRLQALLTHRLCKLASTRNSKFDEIERFLSGNPASLEAMTPNAQRSNREDGD